MLQALFGFLCVFSLCFAVEESDFVRRISMLLWIKQTGKALSECKCARKLYPDSEVLKKMYVEALAKEQYAKKAYRHLKKYAFDKDIKENFSLVEEVAWSFLLQQNDTREHLMIPSLMGASLAKDALGVQFLLQGIASQNFSVRLFSLRLAERYRDEKVSQAVLEAFKREKNFTP